MAHLLMRVGGVRPFLQAFHRSFPVAAASTNPKPNTEGAPNNRAPKAARKQKLNPNGGQPGDMSNNIERLDRRLARVEDIKSVLVVTDTDRLEPNDVSYVLERIGQLCHEDQDKRPTAEEIKLVLDDKRFQMIGQILHDHVVDLNVSAVLSSLSCLLSMSEEDLFLTTSLEMQVLWLQKKMSVRQLVKVFEMHTKHQETDLRLQVFNSTFEQLQKRWVEIVNPHDLVTLMYLAGDTHPSFMEKLEERALDLTGSMSAKALYRILYILSRKQTRNTPLIRSIVYHLNKKFLQLSPVQLGNLLYACAVLQVFNVELLDQITKQVMDDIARFENPKQITALLQSFSILRWKHELLFETLSAAVLKDTCKITPKDAASLLQSCSYVDCMPNNIADTLPQLVAIATDLQDSDPQLWLDLVWNAAVLKCLDNDLVTSVLNEAFMEKLRSAGSTQDKLTADLQQIKLLNIKTAADLELSECSVLVQLQNTDIKVPTRTNRPVLAGVLKALATMAPADKYRNLDVTVPAGYQIDVEMVVNDRAEPQPVHDSSRHDTHRLAFKVLDFSDTHLGSAEPIGLHAMACRHLTLLGYRVIEVSHVDFLQCTTTMKQVQYLSQKMKDAISHTK